MNKFAILTNRKRAIIALIHSVFFLGVALAGFASRKGGIVHGAAPQSDYILVMVYLTVTSILAWLAAISRCTIERVYFVLCTTSAAFGLLRMILGDATLPVAQYMRVLMLSSAVCVGVWIYRFFSRLATEEVLFD